MTEAILLRAIAALHTVTRWLPRPAREWVWLRAYDFVVARGYWLGDEVHFAAYGHLCDATDWGPPCDGDDSGVPF